MPFVLTKASTVQCTHGGSGSVSSPANSKVKADGSEILVESDVHTVSGCSFMIGNTPSPCLKIEWSAAASKVSIGGKAVLLQSSMGQCKAGSGSVQGMAIVANTQSKVQAQ